MPKLSGAMQLLRRLPDLLEPHLRLTFGLGLVLGAVYLGVGGLASAWAGALLGLYLVWDFFRNGGVWIAFRAFREGRMPDVRRELAQVRWSHLLSATARSYYHWLRGALEAADGRFAAARVHLLVAAAGQLRSRNDRALVHCLLAETALGEDDRDGARRQIELARGLSDNPGTDRMINALAARVGLEHAVQL